jgi:hypothetical protein
MVNGTLTFSRITSIIDGEELQHRIQSAKSKGVIPIEKPHTTVSINNASVVYADPNNKSLAEIYAEESFYVSKSNNSSGYCFNAYNKGNKLPDVGVRAEDGVSVNQVIPQGELANGLKVTLVMRVYKPKNAMNNGCSLEAVIVNEPVRYYTGSTVANSLKGFGLVWNPTTATPDNTAAANTAPNAAPQVQQAPVQNPYNNQPQSVPQPAENTNPFSTQQAQQAPAPQYDTFTPDNAAAPTPAPAPNGVITYNGDDRNY